MKVIIHPRRSGNDPVEVDPSDWEVTFLAAMGDTIVAAQLYACQGQTFDPATR